MKRIFMVVLALSLPGSVLAQTNQTPKSTAPVSTKEAPKKNPPTLGFSHIGTTSPIDDDLWFEETQLDLDPDSCVSWSRCKSVHDKRVMHETAMTQEFVEAFQNTTECEGITSYLKTDKKPDYGVEIWVHGHDNPKLRKQTWDWTVMYPKEPGPLEHGRSRFVGIAGKGSQSNAKLTARDVCLAIWDDYYR